MLIKKDEKVGKILEIVVTNWGKKKKEDDNNNYIQKQILVCTLYTNSTLCTAYSTYYCVQYYRHYCPAAGLVLRSLPRPLSLSLSLSSFISLPICGAASCCG